MNLNIHLKNSLNINNKRYGEPPAPPMKRFRYNLHAQQQQQY